MFIILLLLAALIALGVWGVPVLKRKFLGESFQVRAAIVRAFEDPEVKIGDDTVRRNIVDMEIIFPMGRAPQSKEELKIVDDDDRPVEVYWSTPPEREDNVDKGITRWFLREVFFPVEFRQGKLRNATSDLTYIRMPPVPYNMPAN